MEFINLKIYTEYSFDKSIIRINELIKLAKTTKKKYLCITDSNNIFNSIDFYKSCIKNKIKPIIGCDLNIKFKKNLYKFTLLIKNSIGYNNICKLLSRKEITNSKFLKLSYLKGFLKKGLIFILNLSYSNNYLKIKKDISIFKKYFKNNLYLEINPFFKKKFNEVVNFSNYFNISIVPFNPVYFIHKKDFKYCFYKAKIYKNFSFIKTICKKNYFYLKSKTNSLINKTRIKNYLKNTLIIFKKCNFIIKFNKIKLPFYKIKNKLNNRKHLIKLVMKKIKYLNLGTLYKERAIYELKTIISMNLIDYFLIVYDFVNWSKKKNIQVGPGRGSSAGSLVSFLLNITVVDPLRHNLFFERFLNEERSLPDFDIDFCQEKRDMVINYIKKKYGICFVSNIITFNKMNLKSSIKDIGKFLKINYDFINKINKIINNNSNINILELLKLDKNFYKKYKKNKKIKKLVKFCNKLEGLIKNTGVHPGGIVISPDKIYNYFPIKMQNSVITSHFRKANIEDIGLLKFDFLGLITLTIIKNCTNQINNKILKNFNNINLNDNRCYKNLKKGNTVCVFQLESYGIREIIRKIRPENFKNIIAIISLYRPGPIKLINEFHLRKIGKKEIIYINNKLKDILEETYGIIVYQEQIMEIVRIIADYSLSEAYRLIKLICNKNTIEMSIEKKKFLNKSLQKGNLEEDVLKIYNLIKEFANYGFNKSHATAYAFLTYYTLWLKTYFKTNFIAANMSYYCRDIKKFNLIMEDSILNKVNILSADINLSNENFTVVKNSKYKIIRYGLTGITGLGFNIVKSIIKSRKLKGTFKNFIDFYKRMDRSIVNYKSIENLISSGCFDSINQNRANLLEKLNILSSNLNKACGSFYNNIYNKINYYWTFKDKMLEQRHSLGLFLINNINNIYLKKIKKIKLSKNNIYGIIINIFDNFNNNKNSINIQIIDYKNCTYIVKINKELFEKKIKIIKKYNFILIKILKLFKIKDKLIIIPKNIFDIKYFPKN